MSSPIPFEVGRRFGRLVVVAESGRDGYGPRWLCRCDCGTEKTIAKYSLTAGRSVSCGCYNRDLNRERMREEKTVHGHACNGRMTAEYRTWGGIIKRCTNPKTKAFKYYGARGIRVCDRWRESFEAFLADVGPRPSPRHSIDRIDNDGNYEPGNVRWATREEQMRNRSTAHHVEAFGERLTAAEWSERKGIPYATLLARLAKGWPTEEALTRPVRKTRGYHRGGRYVSGNVAR
jgi:hypothetical protein